MFDIEINVQKTKGSENITKEREFEMDVCKNGVETNNMGSISLNNYFETRFMQLN